jgi:DNA invertase Pin-like site-specific DNA recombinase
MENEEIVQFFEKLKEKGTTLSVMLENFDPNTPEEIEFMQSILTSLNDEIDQEISKLK